MSNVKQKSKDKKHCSKCEKDKKLSDFYTSYSPLDVDGKLRLCKLCIQDMVDLPNIESVKNMLRMTDKAFVFHLWESASTKSSPIGEYFKLINAKDFRHYTWDDSIFGNKYKESTTSLNPKINYEIEEDLNSLQPDVNMIKKWGKNYDPEDYYKLEDFYIKMMDANKIETPQEETYLKKLSVISLKMDKELEDGNYAQVKQLGDLFSKYMADSKFRAMDQTDASKTGGLRTFSQIYAEVEKDEFIPPWEEYRKIKGLEQDIVDKTIMHILNYTLKLNKAPQLIEPPDNTPQLEED
jgi:hypothetical protein